MAEINLVELRLLAAMNLVELRLVVVYGDGISGLGLVVHMWWWYMAAAMMMMRW